MLRWIVVVLAAAALALKTPPPLPDSFYGLEARTLEDEDFSFERLRGKVVLITNIASECGYTEDKCGDRLRRYRSAANARRVVAATKSSRRCKTSLPTTSSLSDFHAISLASKSLAREGRFASLPRARARRFRS